jgi:hypothetical protein
MPTYLLAALLLTLSGPLLAQTNGADRVQRFAALPNWSGIWETELSAQLNNGELDQAMTEAMRHPERVTAVLAPRGVLLPAEVVFFSRQQLTQKPPYNAEWDRRYERQKRVVLATPASAVKAGTVKACSWDFPVIMESPTDGVFQVFVTPEETLLLFADGQARHIDTARSHPAPENLWRTALGDSVGRWERDTLVIDTIERKAGPLVRVSHFLSPELSSEAHFTERLRMVSADAMEDQMTIDDPKRFEHPWVLTLRFRRVKNLDRLIPTDCSENDRFRVINGRETIR